MAEKNQSSRAAKAASSASKKNAAASKKSADSKKTSIRNTPAVKTEYEKSVIPTGAIVALASLGLFILFAVLEKRKK